MQKEIHIIKGLPEEGYETFTSRIFSLCDGLLHPSGPAALKLTLTTGTPPALSVIPFKRKKVAVISILDAGENLFEEPALPVGYEGGFLAEEAIPVSYTKSWKDGSPTPGVCLLTLFHKKTGLDQAEFLSRWHEGHTPLSLRLHPLWNYNRNVVLKKLGENSTWYDGIVEEQFRKASDLLNPLVFFGPPLKTPAHMWEVWKDTRSFIDMKRMETFLATEYILKSKKSSG